MSVRFERLAQETIDAGFHFAKTEGENRGAEALENAVRGVRESVAKGDAYGVEFYRNQIRDMYNASAFPMMPEEFTWSRASVAIAKFITATDDELVAIFEA